MMLLINSQLKIRCDPVPLENTCCGETLDETYKYSNYFKSDENVNPLIIFLILWIKVTIKT